MCPQEFPHQSGRRRRGQHRGGPGICQHGRQPFRVPGQSWRKQRDRNVAGVDGAKEGRHILDTLRRHDRHPVPWFGDLLEAGADRTDLRPHVIPAQLNDAPVGVVRVVDEAIRRTLAECCPVLVEKRGQRYAVWHDDRAVGQNVIIDVGYGRLNNTVRQGAPSHQ